MAQWQQRSSSTLECRDGGGWSRCPLWVLRPTVVDMCYFHRVALSYKTQSISSPTPVSFPCSLCAYKVVQIWFLSLATKRVREVWFASVSAFRNHTLKQRKPRSAVSGRSRGIQRGWLPYGERESYPDTDVLWVNVGPAQALLATCWLKIKLPWYTLLKSYFDWKNKLKNNYYYYSSFLSLSYTFLWRRLGNKNLPFVCEWKWDPRRVYTMGHGFWHFPVRCLHCSQKNRVLTFLFTSQFLYQWFP